MRKVCVEILLFHIFTNIYTTECRKYDVHAEAIKLYGEDLTAVVQRFRKTPEYLTILSEKMAESRKLVDTIMVQLKYTFLAKLRAKIAEQMAPEDGKEERVRSGPMHRYGKRLYRRQEEAVEETTSISPIKILDDHVARFTLNVGEVNHYKELAFKYAGDTIHGIIKSMGAEDTPPRSTRLPDGSHEVRGPITTEHPHVHEVTSEGPHSQPPTNDISTADPANMRNLFHFNKRQMSPTRVKNAAKTKLKFL